MSEQKQQKQRQIRIEMMDEMPAQTGLWCDMPGMMQEAINRNKCRIIEFSDNPGKRKWKGDYSIEDIIGYFENPEFSVDMDNSTWVLLSYYYWQKQVNR